MNLTKRCVLLWLSMVYILIVELQSELCSCIECVLHGLRSERCSCTYTTRLIRETLLRIYIYIYIHIFLKFPCKCLKKMLKNKYLPEQPHGADDVRPQVPLPDHYKHTHTHTHTRIPASSPRTTTVWITNSVVFENLRISTCFGLLSYPSPFITSVTSAAPLQASPTTLAALNSPWYRGRVNWTIFCSLVTHTIFTTGDRTQTWYSSRVLPSVAPPSTPGADRRWRAAWTRTPNSQCRSVCTKYTDFGRVRVNYIHTFEELTNTHIQYTLVLP